jgi:hypothetical protein
MPKNEYDALVDLLDDVITAVVYQGLQTKAIALRNLRTALRNKPALSQELQRDMTALLLHGQGLK